jgi:quinol monooxygenase YgiN
MAAVRLVVIAKAKPGSEAIVAKTLGTLSAASPSDPGCLSYECFSSAARPGEFLIVEAWESQAELDAHIQSATVQGAMVTVIDHLDGEPITHVLGPIDG